MTTQNPAAIADTETFTVRRSIRISAPRENVWAAVTDPVHISRWFGPTELDDHGVGTISFPDYGAVPLRVVTVDPQQSVSYRWNNDDALGALPGEFDDTHATTFTFTLTDADDGTELSVVESGFEVTSDPTANTLSHQEGWTTELDKLVTLLEDGVTLVGAHA